MSTKFSIDLPGSEHVGTNAVRIKLFKCPNEALDRMADVKISSDGMSVKVYLMESDLRILAYKILELTNSNLV